ncbi:MAG: hypothetical protein ACJ790_17015 [Myxococcaceae bacterium]
MKKLLVAAAMAFFSCAGSPQLQSLEADHSTLSTQVAEAQAEARGSFDQSSAAADRMGLSGVRCAAVVPSNGQPPPNGVTSARMQLARGQYQARPAFQAARTQGNWKVIPGSCSVVKP